LAQGRPQEARVHFEAAIEGFEEQRQALPSDDMRGAFLTDHLQPYVELLRMAVADDDADAVLWHLDRFRARTLDHRLAERDAGLSAADPDADLLRERLNWLYRRIQRLQEEDAESPWAREEVRRTEQALLEHGRRKRLAAAGAIAPVAAGAHPVQDGAADSDVAALQAALRRALQPGDALVEYGALDDELFACVVLADGSHLRRHLASWTVVLQTLRSTLFQLETLRHGAAPVSQHLDRLQDRAQTRLSQLHDLVWAPLGDLLATCRRVIVVPHAQLGALPFAALHDGRVALGQRHQLAIAPSARAALRGLAQPPAPVRQALVLAESSRLPHAAAEAAVVASCYEQGEVLQGPQATVAKLQARAPWADVLHLACHGQFRGDNPRFSALHLHDGVLTVEDAEQLGLRPCTVVLSACETGLSEGGSGNEMVGLVRAFMVAGAARVVASLWPVDDAVTAGFMRSFHAALAVGCSPSVALQQAQAHTRVLHPHPAYWAAFTVFGGW
jgi:CHAT domain-containing protein